jgi:uncharacterized protein (UPF0303 family)
LRTRKRHRASQWRYDCSEQESGCDEDREIERDLYNRLFESGARFGLTAAAAIRAARAGLQLDKRTHAVSGGATDIVIGNGVAQTNVHGVHFQRECE